MRQTAVGRKLKTMKLEEPSDYFVTKILKQYSKDGGDDLNETLSRLFETFDNDQNKYNILIKVAALNKIYSTAINNINPVVEQILKIGRNRNYSKSIENYVNLVDEIARIKWTSTNSGKIHERNNLSFASKYVHFSSGYKTPIYDSYIWILIVGYLAQKEKSKFSFANPSNFNEFYKKFEKFKKELNLENYSNYQIDKFLWQYGKSLIENISTDMDISISRAKSELKKRIRAGIHKDVVLKISKKN